MTIHIVDYLSYNLPFMNHWQTLVPELFRNEGYDVKVYSGKRDKLGYAEKLLVGDIYYKTTQFEEIFEELTMSKIEDGDIFLFADAWSPTALSLKYHLSLEGMDVKMVGIWREGIYDVNSKIRTGLLRKPKRWAQTYERALYNCYDYNLYVSEEQQDRFIGRYRYKKDETNLAMGFPYESVLDDVKEYDLTKKEDIIVLAHDAYDQEHRDIWYALEHYLDEFTFVDAEELRLHRHEYYDILSKSKAIMAINLAETDPTSIWEGMVFDCVPIIPDRLVYAELFNDRYFYDSHFTSPPMLNFVRGRDYMHETIRKVIHDYNEIISYVRVDADKMQKKLFNNQRWLQFLKKLKYEFISE